MKLQITKFITREYIGKSHIYILKNHIVTFNINFK